MQGTRLGPYEILEQLGAGGMGEVWLAQDTRLGRQVAVKVLPAQFATDAERLARFEQEARAAAALNHPHIAAVYDIGHEGGVHFIVQEHLQGRTLRAAIAEGRLPLAHALKLAIEIAEALRAAHGAGIIHRDLKPENVFVSDDRHAKVLDFGLAKLVEIAVGSGDQSASMSPTVLGTVAGQMMGTAGYMAPEQIDGNTVDARADLFAFGCLLYELATGQQAFRGKNMIDTLHRVSNADAAALGTIDGSLPVELQRLLDKALAKEPDARYQTAGDLAVDLRALLGAVETGKTTPVAYDGVVAGGRMSPLLAAGLVLAGAVLGALAFWSVGGPSAPPPNAPTHFEFDLVRDTIFTGSGRRPLAISPDGRRIAFTDENFIWLRELSDPELIQVRGTEDPRGPAFSPDGQSIVFYAAGELRRVPITGGAPIRLADLEGNTDGVSWESDGTILVGQSAGIVRVPETGGEPELLIPLDEGQEMNGPSLLPGGEWVLFAVNEGSGSFGDASVVAQSLASGERRLLVAGGTEPRYLASGHLTFARDGNLLAVPFDAATLEVTGGAVVLVEGIPMAGVSGGAYYDVSRRGDLVYFGGAGGNTGTRQLAWYDLGGALEVLPFEADAFDDPRVSPDGRRVAVSVRADQGDEIWILDLTRASRQRLTDGDLDAGDPVWSQDGEWVYAKSGDDSLVRIRSDFTGVVETIGEPGLDISPADVSADGRWLVADSVVDGAGTVSLVELETGEITHVVSGPFFAIRPQFSPDGRHVAYLSGEGGGVNVFVYDRDTGRRQIVSTAGAGLPVWNPDGSALYYRSGLSTVMVVDVEYEPELRLSPQRRLFDSPAMLARPFNDIHIAPDGSRFLVMTASDTSGREEDGAPGRMHVVVDWGQVLRERVRSR